MEVSALSIQISHEDIGKHDTGPHLSTVGKVAAEQPDRSTNRCKAEMKLTDKTDPEHLTQKVSRKASPRGSWPEGPERAGMEVSALSIQISHEDIGKHDTGPHLSTVGKVAAKQPDRATNRCKSEMKLTDKTDPEHLTQKVSRKASPRGVMLFV